MKQFFTLIFALVFTTSVMAQSVGETPPDFSLKDLAEMDYILSANKGKVIMIFLVGYNCPLCIASAPDVKTDIVNVFASTAKFQPVVIDVWDGSKAAVQGFASSTGLDATFLQKGSGVASSWSATYDRLYVVDSSGKLVFKGSKSARSQISPAKSAIQTALNNVVTSSPIIDEQEGFSLSQNYPNPVRSSTTIKFRLDEASQVDLSVYDITGKMVAAPINDFYERGEHEFTFNRNGLQNGIYFYRLNTAKNEAVKRMVLQ
jgi:peroxiredoxin